MQYVDSYYVTTTSTKSCGRVLSNASRKNNAHSHEVVAVVRLNVDHIMPAMCQQTPSTVLQFTQSSTNHYEQWRETFGFNTGHYLSVVHSTADSLLTKMTTLHSLDKEF